MIMKKRVIFLCEENTLMKVLLFFLLGNLLFYLLIIEILKMVVIWGKLLTLCLFV